MSHKITHTYIATREPKVSLNELIFSCFYKVSRETKEHLWEEDPFREY